MLPVEVWGDRCKPEFADAFTYVLYVWHETPHLMENDHGASGGRGLDEERGHPPAGALKAEMTLLQFQVVPRKKGCLNQNCTEMLPACHEGFFGLAHP